MNIWIYGNIDDTRDGLPVRLIPKLAQQFPDHVFVHRDPLDDDEFPTPLIIIDAVDGINRIEHFTSLDEFIESPGVTLHDFDVFSQLRLAQKIHKLPELHIIGVPLDYNEQKAFRELIPILAQFSA